MKKHQDIEVETLRAMLSYHADSGKLFWRERPAELFPDLGPGGAAGAASRWNACWAGKEAFTTTRRDGYMHSCIMGRSYLGHRVAFALQHGHWPQFVDHINGNRSDNRAANLREANRSQNNCNASRREDNSSGFKGVKWNKKQGCWHAAIQHEGKRRHLGSFKSAELANAAYVDAAARLHGDFARGEA